MGHPREEVEEAFAEFIRLGVENRDWPAWAALFTDDAEYIEHNLGHYSGQPAIHDWIVDAMAPFPNMTFSVDWHVIEGDRVAFYIWNHLPDPAGGDTYYSFPNISLIDYAGDGKWFREEDFYNPADAEPGRRPLVPGRRLEGDARERRPGRPGGLGAAAPTP